VHIEGYENLSPREKEVLEFLAGGFMYKEIADKMGIALDTVKKHVVSIYAKLHVSNKVEAINKFNQFNS
jgi:DNA-binding NarL/FixJ family response regulator